MQPIYIYIDKVQVRQYLATSYFKSNARKVDDSDRAVLQLTYYKYFRRVPHYRSISRHRSWMGGRTGPPAGWSGRPPSTADAMPAAVAGTSDPRPADQEQRPVSRPARLRELSGRRQAAETGGMVAR